MPNNPVLAVAEAVSDAVDVDWVSAESSATEAGDREAVRQLRLVAGIGQAARALAARWGPFELREQIGHGSFGTVYRAWDRRLDKEIALKLLHEGAATGTEVIHEARVLATVEHPNIVPVYGADVHDGRVGIWMKFIRGKTLKDILVEQGPFGAEEAAQIGRELCRALAAVHRKGFVHRDIKAQNVMREVGGRYLLMDFGAGDTVEAARDGDIKGSPAYLAPEVVAGGAPTAQSDIYSLGVLLYHLVTGAYPVVASSWSELHEAHRKETRISITDAGADVPDWYLRAVDRATAPHPSARIQRIGDFERLLDRPARAMAPVSKLVIYLMLLAFTGTLVVALGWRLQTESASTASGLSVGPQSISVVPFTNATKDPKHDYLSAGITQEVVAHLASLKDLRIVSLTAALPGAGTKIIPSSMSTGLALLGSVDVVGTDYRIEARLVDVATAQTLWSGVTVQRAIDLVAIPAAVAMSVAEGLRPLASDENVKGLAVRRSQVSAAYDLYLRGRQLWSTRTEAALNESLLLYQTAWQLDPTFALALAGAADSYIALGTYGYLPRSVAYARAAANAERAVAIAPSLYEAQLSLAYSLKNGFDWKRSEQAFRLATDLRPSHGQGHHWYSILLTQLGRFDEAFAEITQALAIDPNSVGANLQFASLLMMARRYDEALRQYEHSLTIGANVMNAYRGILSCHVLSGDKNRAEEAAARLLERTGARAEDQQFKADLGYMYAAFGRRDEATRLIQELSLRHERSNEMVAGSIAAIYAGLHDVEAATKWLEVAVARSDPEVGYLLVDPRWDLLRGTDRFKRLVASVFPSGEPRSVGAAIVQ